MRYGLMVVAAALTMGLGTVSSEAAPLALQPAVDTGPAPQIELVRGGCGFGAHRTYSGYCHRNYGWRGRVRAWRRW